MKISLSDLGVPPGRAEPCTQEFQRAVDACAAAGGGTVIVPAGEFTTGSVRLRSNLTVEVAEGGIWRGSGHLEDYPPVPFRHNEFGEVRSLAWAISERNIRLCGRGEIDFNHPAFIQMDMPDTRGPDGDRIASLRPEQIVQTTVLANPRPNQPIFFHDCERVRVDDLLLRRSPCWTLTFSVSRDLRVRGVTVDNHLRVPNCDGVHLSASRDALISDCVFRCADDCVAITGITDWERPSENIVVIGCTMVSRSAGVRIGHLASKVRNVVCSDLVLSDGNRGISIFAGDGGWVEDVQVHDVVLHTRLFAGFWWGKGEPLVIAAPGEGSGRVEGVHVTRVRGTCEGGIVLAGRAGSVREVTLSDWNLRVGAGANRPELGQWIDLQPERCRPLEPGHIPWLYADGLENVELRRVCVRRDLREAEAYSTEALCGDNDGLRIEASAG